MILIIGGAYQGKRDFLYNTFNTEGKEILFNFHELIRGYTQEEIKAFLAEALEKYDFVICNETGSSIVPLERADREYRENAGRALCYLAQNAKEVWRVYCGIGTRIK